MKTKSILFLICFLNLFSAVIAQNADKVEIASVIKGKNTNSAGLEQKSHYWAAVNVQFPIAPIFLFQPGLLYTPKVAKHGNSFSTNKYPIGEMLLNVVYKSMLGNGFITMEFGPYLNTDFRKNIFAKIGLAETAIEFRNTVLLGNQLMVNYFKPPGAGNNVSKGFEMASGIFCQLYTNIGLLKIIPENRLIPNVKSLITSTGFSLSTSYRF